MKEEEYLSPQQSKLINFAIWAKYLAWLFLGINILLAGVLLVQNVLEVDDLSTRFRFVTVINIALNIIPSILHGVISFIVLKGISLGLYMIVETDINYREQEQQGDSDE